MPDCDRRGTGSRYDDFLDALNTSDLAKEGSSTSTSALSLSSSQLKVSRNYTFDAANKTIKVNDNDLHKILSVINLTDGIVIYNPTEPSLGGTEVANSLNFEYDTTSMSNTDNLLILYEYTPVDKYEILLDEILIELRKQTKFLEKIYK